jgi:signal transduction histidine kinase
MLAVTALAIALFGVPLAVGAHRLYHGQEITRLQRTATLAADAVPVAGLRATKPSRLPIGPDDASVALYTVHGQRVMGRGPATGDRAINAALSGRLADTTSGKMLVAAVPIVHSDDVIGAARASVPASVVTHRTERTWLVMGLLAALALLVAAGLGRREAERLVRPVHQLTGMATRLGDGDFTVHGPRSGIDEIDDAGDALASTASRLGSVLERERAFSADASHQLATPLTGLRATLETALLLPGADARDAIGDAVEQVDRLEATVRHLLDLARDSNIERGALDVQALLTELERAYAKPFSSAGRSLRIEVERDLPTVHASAAAVRQILIVLLDNALVHGAGPVVIHARPVGPGIAVAVTDSGPGIDTDPDRIFQRRGTDSAGTGIGLALARTLAEAEGARLLLRAPGPEPEFALLLPQSAPPERSPHFAER